MTQIDDDRVRWRRLEEVFATASEMSDAQREAYLLRSCEGDEVLRRELLSLLSAAELTTGPLDRPPVFREAQVDDTKDIGGTRLGPWAVDRLLGRGGAGDVYLAHRADGTFAQQVAVKLLRLEAVNQIDRFHAERQILARLEHPGIARLLDGGVTDTGQPYAVVEYVDGRPLLEYCRTSQCNLEERLRLFCEVCEVVAYAHRNLIIHRDLKSNNILVTADSRVKLLDFGIAKQLDNGTWPNDEHTSAPFTADYAAPEQLTGEPVSTATDVYALGVLLFELLTDRRPWAHGGMPLARIVKSIINQRAPIPSEVISADAKQSAQSVLIGARAVAGDLDAIVAKCLRKEPAHRYATVDELRSDIKRHQNAQPVAARERARAYLFHLWLRRNRWAAAGVATVVISLASGLAIALWQAQEASLQSQRATEQARIARGEAQKAAFVKDFLLDIFSSNSSEQPDPVKARSTTALELLDRAAARLKSDAPADPAANDELLSTIGTLYADLGQTPVMVELRSRRLALAKQNFAHNDPRVIEALLQHGAALYEAEGWKDAIASLTEADNLLKENGDNTSRTRAKLDSLLGEYWRSTDLERSRFHVTRSVELYRSRFPGDVDFVNALIAAAQTASETDTVKGAYYYQLAVDTQRRLKMALAYQVQPLVMLAEAQRSLMESSKSEQNFLAAIAMSERVNGSDHIDTFQAQMRYGMLLRLTGSFREGAELLQSVESRARLVLGEKESFHLPTIRFELANHLFQWGDIERSDAIMIKALAIREQTRPNTRNHASMLVFLAQQLIARGRTDEATRQLDRAEKIFSQVGVPLPLTWLDVYRTQLLLAQGRGAQALKKVDDDLRANEKLGAEVTDAWRDVRRMSSMTLMRAKALIAVGDFAGAESILKLPVPNIEIADVAKHYVALEVEKKVTLGLLYLRTGRSQLAAPLLREALAWRRTHHHPQSPQLLEACVALASALLASGDRDASMHLASEARSIISRHRELGPQYLNPYQALRASLGKSQPVRQ